MIVVNIDQRKSRSRQDRVPQLLETLQNIPVAVAFERTVGDEVQGVVRDGEALLDMLALVMRHDDWHVGIGIGAGELPGSSTREGRGPAFICAREAVDAAKKDDSSLALRAEHASPQSRWAGETEVTLRMLAYIYYWRTDNQWAVIDRLHQGKKVREIADELGISASAVSQRKRAARYDYEQDVRMLAADFLENLIEDEAAAADAAGGTS